MNVVPLTYDICDKRYVNVRKESNNFITYSLIHRNTISHIMSRALARGVSVLLDIYIPRTYFVISKVKPLKSHKKHSYQVIG